jgi:hypothetical protein
VVVKNTKRELDVSRNRVDELELILQTLEKANNLDFENVKNSNGDPSLLKEPVEIVTDYLTKVYEYVSDSFKFLGSNLRAKIEVDIVVTVPVVRLILHALYGG